MRLSVNADGDRMDDPAIVHEINVLTVVANESYKDFVTGLQKDISATLSSRPKLANEEYFVGKILKTADGELIVTQPLAKLIERYLVKNDYTDTKDHITETYHIAKKDDVLAPLPPELEPYKQQVFQLINSVFSAETKGSLSSMDLRKIEESKIECARKFFAKITTDQVKYDVADSYGKLMELVK